MPRRAERDGRNERHALRDDEGLFQSTPVGQCFLLPGGHTVTSLHLGSFLFRRSYLWRDIAVEELDSLFLSAMDSAVVASAARDIS